MNLRIVRGDRIGDLLHDHRLAGLGRRDDHPALTFAERCHEVDHTRRQDVRLGFQAKPFLRIERCQLVEVRTAAHLLRVATVDGVEPDKRVELLASLAFARLPDGAGDRVALAQAMSADLRE